MTEVAKVAAVVKEDASVTAAKEAVTAMVAKEAMTKEAVVAAATKEVMAAKKAATAAAAKEATVAAARVSPDATLDPKAVMEKTTATAELSGASDGGPRAT
jgi:hypothetical protein